MSKWISVKDRLPHEIDGYNDKVENRYLVCMNGGFIVTADYFKPSETTRNMKDMWSLDLTDPDYYKDDDFYITHWMPLPKPPNENYINSNINCPKCNHEIFHTELTCFSCGEKFNIGTMYFGRN